MRAKTLSYVLIVPAHLPSRILEARDIQTFMMQRSSIPSMIGVTHTNHPNAWHLKEIQFALGDCDGNNIYVDVNPNEKKK